MTAMERMRQKYLAAYGLALTLKKDGSGWSYEWTNPDTRSTVSMGWAQGTRREGEQEAVGRLAELGLGVRR